MDRKFAGKGALTIGTALLTDHDCLEVSDFLFKSGIERSLQAPPLAAPRSSRWIM